MIAFSKWNNNLIVVFKTNIQIENSCYISKRYFKNVLETAKQSNEDSDVWKRSMFSLKMEWAVHNALYALGLWKDRTREVDLNYPNKIEFVYCILGVLVWPFIR